MKFPTRPSHESLTTYETNIQPIPIHSGRGFLLWSSTLRLWTSKCRLHVCKNRVSFLLLGGKALGKPFMSRQYTCMSQSIRCSALHPLASRRSTAPPGADILGLRPMLSLLTGVSRNTRSNAPEWLRDLIDLADFGIGFVKMHCLTNDADGLGEYFAKRVSSSRPGLFLTSWRNMD